MSEHTSILTLSRRLSPRRILCVLGAFAIFSLILMVKSKPSWSTQLPDNELSSDAEPHHQTSTSSAANSVTSGTNNIPRNSFVVASKKGDDTTWIDQHLSDWNLVRYMVDDHEAQYTVPENKGRESMVYLTYIIDNYEKLPEVIVFMHADRYQWHNDDPIYDGVPLLQNLQVPYLLSQGYTNLRCVWTLGCPSELKLNEISKEPVPTDPKGPKTTEFAYPEAFKALFPGEELPDTIGVACCAQFAVTGQKIRERPLSDYSRYRDWILQIGLDDHISGRVLEYSWHIIFGRKPVHCPNAKECYCNVYGLCRLECDGEGKCGDRWPFPPSATLPSGWPRIGWNGEVRSDELLAELRQTAIVDR